MDTIGLMRRVPEKVWHLLIVTLWGVPLVTPLLRWTAVPCTHDGHLHYHRIAAMRYAWENGLFFSRWLPDLAFGYGYPFFIYREPAPLYFSLMPHLLGMPLPAAENLLYLLSILAAGWFMYLWVRDLFGARAGLVAALAYMAAPYVLVDALVRGNAPESVALSLMPLLLWIGRRWLLKGSWQSFVIGVSGLALFALSHNISLLLFTPFLLVYLLMIGWLYQLDWRVTAVRLFLLFALGLGMTSFYTGGALLEMDQVTLSQSTTTRNNDFRYNFATLREIFAPVTAEDPSLINPPLPFRLGWVPFGLAVLGVGRWLWRQRGRGAEGQGSRGAEERGVTYHVSRVTLEQQWHVGLMVGVTAVYLLLALSISLPLWENIPLIDFTQFPWRFVGRAALPVALLAGVLFAEGWESRRAGEQKSRGAEETGEKSEEYHASRIRCHALRITFYAALVLLALEAFPLLYPTLCDERPFPTINTVHRYEQETGLVGVDPEGSYFPKTVEVRPKTSPLVADYQAGEVVQRWDTAVLPDGAMSIETKYENLAATLRLTTPEPFTVRYFTFAFPGWTATVDGEPVPIQASDPEGLITFAVPAGEHTIAVRWQATPLRAVLLGFSVMALAGAVMTAVILRIEQGSRLVLSKAEGGAGEQACPEQGRRRSRGVEGRQLVILAGLGIGLLALKGFVVDRTDTIFRRPSSPNVALPMTLQGNELRLLGYNLSQARVPSGETFDVDMAWTAVAPPAADYQTNIWLVDENGLVWSDKETHRPRLYEDTPSTRFWQPGQWAWDSREVAILSGTPPGEYRLVLTLFERTTLQPITLVDSSTGAVVGPTAVLGQITITPPSVPPEFRPQFSLETEVGLAHLSGYNQDRQEAAPGEPILFTFFWQRSEAAQVALSLEQNEDRVHEWQIQLPNGRYRSQHLLRLPANLASGDYTFVLNDTLPLGQLWVNAPERIFEQPEVETMVNAAFTDTTSTTQATLIGYTLAPRPSPLALLTLIWQANADITTSYRVFIHLVDESGQIVVQTDGEPANWARPTTGWAVGEYIVDVHQLDIPAELPRETLSLRVGLYNAETGERLETETADFMTILLSSP